ncbi:hypothetical protein Ancab_010173, partial [Ancistrocladus abbreviatus]
IPVNDMQLMMTLCSKLLVEASPVSAHLLSSTCCSCACGLEGFTVICVLPSLMGEGRGMARVGDGKGGKLDGGDKYLKPFVTSEPEITFRRRESEDECLVIASDGLWDTTSNQLACDVVRECLEGRPISPTDADAFELSPLAAAIPVFPSRTMLAAALLTRLALGRGSSDNISIIAIDLTRR